MIVLVTFLVLVSFDLVIAIGMTPPSLFGFIFLFSITILLCIPLYFAWEFSYFREKKFLDIKQSIQKYTDDCNELNTHIEELKHSYIDIHYTDYGTAIYTDNSLFNFKRSELKKYKKESNIYDCSLTVCKNAQQQPFKYICKYFNIQANEQTLANFEKVFNDFSAADQGRNLLVLKKKEILSTVSYQIPFFIRHFRREKLAKKLGFNDIDLTDVHYPSFCFRYISAGGNSSMKCEIIFDLRNLEKFISYLSEKVKFKNSVAGQRALMTSQLREYIKKRDNYTCKYCGVSTQNEPHLLLEIDHIIPLSKNGLTTEDNLQTLCWKCNRTKGSKIQ